MHACMYVFPGEHACVSLDGAQRLALGVFIALHLTLEIGSLSESEAHWLS